MLEINKTIFNMLFQRKKTIWKNFVSCCIHFLSCHNKTPQTRWFKTTEIYSLIVLWLRCPKSRCEQGNAPCECSRGEFFLASFQLLIVASNPLHSLASPLYSQPLASHGLFIFFSKFLFCVSVLNLPPLSPIKITAIAFRAHPNPVGPHLNSIISAKTLFQIRSYSQVPGTSIWSFFDGNTIQPTTAMQDINFFKKLCLLEILHSLNFLRNYVSRM